MNSFNFIYMYMSGLLDFYHYLRLNVEQNRSAILYQLLVRSVVTLSPRYFNAYNYVSKM